MRLLRALAPMACVCALVLSYVGRPASGAAASARVRPSSTLMEQVWFSGEDVNYTYAPRSVRRAGLRSADAQASSVSATFEVTYDAGFNANPAAKAAFQIALDNWSHVVTSPASIPIKVNAKFIQMGSSQLLGTALPTEVCASSAGLANTFYVAALANALNQNTFCGAGFGAQIDISLNSANTNWDFSTAAVAGKVNFITVAMHELGHGLGIYSSMDSAGGVGSFGYAPDHPGFVDAYDRFAVNGAGTLLINFANPSTALHAQLISDNIFFNGTTATFNNNATHPKLESRNFGSGDHGFVPGSSYQHVDDRLYTGTPNGMMTYQLGFNEAYMDPGPIARGILADLGWTIDSCTYSLSPTSAAAPTAGGTATVALTTPAGCDWTASSGNTAIATITSAASGTGSATISYNVSANTGLTQRTVTLTIGGQFLVISQAGTGATVSIDKSSLIFSGVTNGVSFVSQTPAQTVRLISSGTGTASWTAASTRPWITVSPTSGSGPATLTINAAFVSGLQSTQTAQINLSFTGATNTAGPIAVTLNTIPNGTTAPPVGVMDTPTDHSTGVAGSVPVTGWAIDDVAVTRVRIMRDPVEGEPAGSLVFIGDAVQVDGARPDVQASFPDAPRNTIAGWGYLLLSNFLPNLGNGTFRLTAIADDADGHSTILGSKTITCSNSTSPAPFGAIDTPAQGGVVSGNMVNFGWVLSRGPRRADPPSGGRAEIVIDGAIIATQPSEWTSRGDLSAVFPAAEYPGIVNALGVAQISTTAMTNGVHSISWITTDDHGMATGIGSRYFTVSNGSQLLGPAGTNVISNTGMVSVPRAAAMRLHSRHTLVDEVGAAPADGSAIEGRRGFDAQAPLQAYASRAAVTTIQSEEQDRIELHLGAGRSYAGYLRTPDGLCALPIGSALEASTGVFTWQPGVGFIGSYDLVFVEWVGGRALTRRDVRIVLNPKGSGRVGPQTVIDIADGDLVAGWAADLDSSDDTGVDTVHVWAYPVRSGGVAVPIFLGVAAYGGSRPDVAAVYGDRFARSGFGLRVEGLAPGTYDLAVFAYSTVRGGFVPAKTVRVVLR